MDLRRFVTFKTIVEEGSFAKAAQKLYCTQSTVTFHIQQLEQELGVQLFEKIGRRMIVTPAGKKLLPEVHELTRVLQGIRQLAQQDADLTGDLRVVVGETLLAYKMPAVLQRFRTKAPQVRLFLQSMNCYAIRDALLSDAADLGIFYRVGKDESLYMENLGEQSLVLVASPLCDNLDFIEASQHIPTSFIINEPECIFRQIFESTLRERRITLENTIELWSIESIKKCVASNLGVSYLPRFSVEHELQSGVLKELPFSHAPQKITALYAHHIERTVSPAMRVFAECMHECFV